MLLYRVLTSVVGVPLILAVFFFGGIWGNAALFSAAFLIGAYEFASMAFKDSKQDRFVSVLSSAILFFFAAISPVLFNLPTAWELAAGFSLAAGLPALYVLFNPKNIEKATARIGYLLLGALYTGGLFAMLPRLYYKGESVMNGLGAKWLVLMLAVVWLGDTAAYFAGRALGKHKLYPAVSPKKTWEGSIGGLIGSAAGAVLFLYILGIEQMVPPVYAVLLGIVGGTIEQVGDLFESLIKRSFGVKDSGNLLPGHGGILDRLDGVLAASPIFFVALYALF